MISLAVNDNHSVGHERRNSRRKKSDSLRLITANKKNKGIIIIIFNQNIINDPACEVK